MPDVYFTFEDSAPFISYSSDWRPGSSDDKQLSRYSESSFMLTNKAGEAMSFKFTGSEAAIYGALRGNHGRFEVQVNQSIPTSRSGSAQVDVFRDPLFREEFPQGEHSVILRNLEEGKYLDVDFVSLKSRLGGEGGSVEIVTVQNTITEGDHKFVYFPPTNWETVAGPNSYMGGSGHITSAFQSSVTLKFKGHAVALYGPSGRDYTSRYSVSLDDGPQEFFSAKRDYPVERHQQLMYLAAGLDGGSHEIKVSLDSPGDTLAIDYANVYIAKGDSGSSSLSGSRSASPAMVFGITFSSGIAFLLLVALLFLFLRRRGYLPFFGRNSDVRSLRRSRSRVSIAGDSKSTVSTISRDMSFTEISTQYAPSSWGPASSWGTPSNAPSSNWAPSSAPSFSSRGKRSKLSGRRPSLHPTLPSIQDNGARTSVYSDIDSKTVEIKGPPNRDIPGSSNSLQAPSAAYTQA
ncbi:hypothetical protein CC1G_03309 [Coprinopsis cinerea okayama7|uniref:Transmembrane protein n=1 Tax=Coprinopsis cinerea (strain Okayama-7 / 130 / ATCC MYA-4618 / FGSC 9003) TaxID=240176 RepID=A8N7G6_COPC7|nr:hypothetical protein CC1G_03309 [Coprinopsis cinerea okayama7\|eukprot:XP_001830772.2 hypothetical protein CC1G_03309 [Coprinopsis cinerea okayama7\